MRVEQSVEIKSTYFFTVKIELSAYLSLGHAQCISEEAHPFLIGRSKTPPIWKKTNIHILGVCLSIYDVTRRNPD